MQKIAAAYAKQLHISFDDALVMQGALTKLLAAAARGEIDLNLLAREELACRGLDQRGNWVGFQAAAKIHQVQ